MKIAFLGLVLSVLSVTGCPASTAKCDKAVDNIMAKCGTCFGTSTSSTSSRTSRSCRQTLMGMCGSSTSASSFSSSSPTPDAFLNCVANATSCDGILLCR